MCTVSQGCRVGVTLSTVNTGAVLAGVTKYSNHYNRICGLLGVQEHKLWRLHALSSWSL